MSMTGSVDLISSFRGLFEVHKLVFSFMLCADIMRQAEEISVMEWNFFLRGAAGINEVGIMS